MEKVYIHIHISLDNLSKDIKQLKFFKTIEFLQKQYNSQVYNK